MVSSNLIWIGLAGLSALGIVEETFSTSLPGWLDTVFEIPFDLLVIAVGLWGVLA